MRRLAFGLAIAAGVALSFPGSAQAADTGVPAQYCPRGQIWDGYECAWPAPRVRAPAVEYEYAEPVEVAPVYVAPPVYIARPFYGPRYYARPYYARPYHGRHYYVRHHAPRHGWAYHRPGRHYARR